MDLLQNTSLTCLIVYYLVSCTRLEVCCMFLLWNMKYYFMLLSRFIMRVARSNGILNGEKTHTDRVQEQYSAISMNEGSSSKEMVYWLLCMWGGKKGEKTCSVCTYVMAIERSCIFSFSLNPPTIRSKLDLCELLNWLWTLVITHVITCPL